MFEHGTEFATAELYDPAAGTWSAAGSMAVRRVDHTATLLPSGQVLAVGGCDSSGCHASAELYDPATNTWRAAAAPLSVHRTHTATLLPSGKVLVVGGVPGVLSKTVELYDPAADTWSPAAPSLIDHSDHTATLLPSGKVLVVGGSDESDAAELYDPETNTWSLTGELPSARYGHTATLLPSGKVLVVGGRPWVGDAFVEIRAELYDPETGTWSRLKDTGSMRVRHRTVVLPSGQVLVVGSGYAGYAPGMLYTP
jgi:N-acetylneuraminic acid mutarotase